MHVVLSLGSNIDREKNIRFALQEIRDQYGDIEVSPIYETSSVGFDGPSFFNLVVGMQSSDPVEDIIGSLQQIETVAGRVRGPKSFDSRILDIDVILYGTENFRPDRNIPRDEIEKYAYVLKPLSDLYPELTYPMTGETFAVMWKAFEMKDQTAFMAEFPLEI
ncbi:MAG: 2-amino-4-hydroxy-6-hydroxymethyldihydropteridine diphosphokinase [Pseudomonadota bacterium]